MVYATQVIETYQKKGKLNKVDKVVEDIFKCIFVNEKFCILIEMSLKFVPNGPIDNNQAIGLDDCLASYWRQPIICTNADPIH